MPFTNTREDLARAFLTPEEVERFTGTGRELWSNIAAGSSPTVLDRGTGWKTISASQDVTQWWAGIKTDGRIWSAGLNTFGQLGNGANTDVGLGNPVTTVGGGIDWRDVSAGQHHTIAIKNDGTLWTWGLNSSGQLGTGDVLDRSSPGTTVGGGNNWLRIAAGVAHSAAIKVDGTLWTWGAASSGQLGNASTTSQSSPITTAGGGTNWKFVAAGYNATGGVKTDGTLWTWGSNLTGRLGDGTTIGRSSPVTTAGGGTNWKTVYFNSYSAGAYAAGCKTDGTLWTWGNGAINGANGVARSSPGQIAGGGSNWKTAGLGANFGFAIKTDGSMWSWGNNDGGKLTDGTLTSRLSPVRTLGNNKYKQVSLTDSQWFAIADT